MKYTEDRIGKIKQIVYTVEFEIQKIKACSKCLVGNKEERNKRKAIFKSIYGEHRSLSSREDNSLPQDLYVKPIAIFASDLMPANEIEQIRSGFIRLIHKQKSNKFLGGSLDLKRIENIRVYEPGADFWSNLGVIDFENNHILREKVSHVDIKLRNLNESYLMIDLEIVLANQEIEKIDAWMREDRQEETVKYAKHFQSKGKGKTGSKYWVGKVFYNGSMMRLAMLEREYAEIKKMVFDEIAKYLPLQLHIRDIVQPSCVLYKSNLNKGKKTPDNFLDSIGLMSYIIKPESFIVKDISSFMYSVEQSKGANQYVIYMDHGIEKEDMYYSKDFQLICQFEDIYVSMGRKKLAKYLYNDFRDMCIEYRSKFKNIAISRKSLKKLYELRMQYFQEINFFRTASNVEATWFDNEKEAEKLLVIAYDKLISAREWVSFNRNDKMSEFSSVIDKEIEDKIVLCKDLSDRHQNIVSSLVAILSLLISFIALLVAMNIDFVHFFEWILGK